MLYITHRAIFAFGNPWDAIGMQDVVLREVFATLERNMCHVSHLAQQFHSTISLPAFRHQTPQKIRESTIFASRNDTEFGKFQQFLNNFILTQEHVHFPDYSTYPNLIQYCAIPKKKMLRNCSFLQTCMFLESLVFGTPRTWLSSFIHFGCSLYISNIPESCLIVT